MQKLSTDAIKKLIEVWLSDPKLKDEVCNYHYLGDSNEELSRMVALFDFPIATTAEQFRERIWDLWSKGKNWKRDEKRRLDDEYGSYFYDGQFAEDFCGSSDVTSVIEVLSDTAVVKRCWLRVFVPNNQLGDNFRLEVVTMPDDSKVVGWMVVVD